MGQEPKKAGGGSGGKQSAGLRPGRPAGSARGPRHRGRKPQRLPSARRGDRAAVRRGERSRRDGRRVLRGELPRARRARQRRRRDPDRAARLRSAHRSGEDARGAHAILRTAIRRRLRARPGSDRGRDGPDDAVDRPHGSAQPDGRPGVGGVAGGPGASCRERGYRRARRRGLPGHGARATPSAGRDALSRLPLDQQPDQGLRPRVAAVRLGARVSRGRGADPAGPRRRGRVGADSGGPALRARVPAPRKPRRPRPRAHRVERAPRRRLLRRTPRPRVRSFPRDDCLSASRRAEDAGDFAARLLEKHGTAVAPGAFFGAPAHFRISFGGATDRLAAGLEAIARCLDEGAG
jgi:hypothetical protein